MAIGTQEANVDTREDEKERETLKDSREARSMGIFDGKQSVILTDVVSF